MKRQLTVLGLLVVPLCSWWILGVLWNATETSERTATVVTGPLEVWSSYEGRLQSRTVRSIMSKLAGTATVVELAPEGAGVAAGDVLVRFDSSALERDVLQLERDYALARSALQSLEHAEIPLALRELELELLETRSTLRAEQQYLTASIELKQEDLVSDQEVEQQELKVAEVTTQLRSLEMRMQLTKEYLHPSELKSAQARLASAEQELALSREQLENSTVRSPMDGVVIHKSLPIGTEFRAIRVGDNVFPNQPFMVLPDMNDLVVYLEVPEGELTRLGEQKYVLVQPLAYPDLRLPGIVETVGSMAQSTPGQPAWQKFFHVVVGLEELDPRLRPGMSTTAHILSYSNPDAVLISRNAVIWEGGKPFARLVAGSSSERRELTLGMADEKHYEVIEGLNPGDEILVE